jgi:hypothetical protein
MDIKMKLFNISAYLDIVKARLFLPHSPEESGSCGVRQPCEQRLIRE